MARLMRTTSDKMIAGVCGGIARRLEWDVSVVRLLYVLPCIFTAGFPGLLIYIILWAVMPKDN